MVNTADICREVLHSTYKSVLSYYIKSKLILGTLIIVLPAMSSSCSVDDSTCIEENGIMIQKSIRLTDHDGTRIKSADIFTFNNDRLQKLDSYQRIENIDACSLKLATRTGDKKIFICANGGWQMLDWIGINSIEALKEIRAEIEDERWTAPIMTGEAMFSADDLQNIEVEMKMIAAEVQVRSLSVNFSGKGYEGEELTDIRVYLTNVNASCSLVPGETVMPERVINYGGYNEDDIRMMSEPGLIFQKVVCK